MLSATAAILVLTFMVARAPHTPNPRGAAAAVATQYPTITPGPSPTFGPPPTALPPTATATPELGGPGRDDQRRRDLQTIGAALERYHDDKGRYPSTGRNIQSFCTYENIDEGCNARDYFDGAIPTDPSTHSQYQYLSDGSAWTVVATMEVSLSPADRCLDERVPLLPDKDRVYCLIGPARSSTPTATP